MLRPLEEFSLTDHQDQRTKRRANDKYGMKSLYKEEVNKFNEVRQLANVQKGENLIQTTELQGLQIDPKIQIKNLRNLPKNSLKHSNLITLQYNPPLSKKGYYLMGTVSLLI